MKHVMLTVVDDYYKTKVSIVRTIDSDSSWDEYKDIFNEFIAGQGYNCKWNEFFVPNPDLEDPYDSFN